MQQTKLDKHQIEEFYIDGWAPEQVEHFIQLTADKSQNSTKCIVDIGGGCGFFAQLLHSRTGHKLRVIDSDKESINRVTALENKCVSGVLGDALEPPMYGDEDIVTFNLMLHHLIGDNEGCTRELQKRALSVWREKAKYIFVNEYVYDSLFGNFSGRAIYEITKNKLLSAIGRVISRFIPSLKANTFGVGVRFRAHGEWVELFEECGFSVVSRIHNEPEYVPTPRRFILLIKQVRRDSFLLAKRTCG